MRTVYKFIVSARCPVDPEVRDVYDVAIRSDGKIPVEDILAAVAELPQEPIYQEDLTQKLSDTLQLPVRTVGVHSGVETICAVP